MSTDCTSYHLGNLTYLWGGGGGGGRQVRGVGMSCSTTPPCDESTVVFRHPLFPE